MRGSVGQLPAVPPFYEPETCRKRSKAYGANNGTNRPSNDCACPSRVAPSGCGRGRGRGARNVTSVGGNRLGPRRVEVDACFNVQVCPIGNNEAVGYDRGESGNTSIWKFSVGQGAREGSYPTVIRLPGQLLLCSFHLTFAGCGLNYPLRGISTTAHARYILP
jgi:hypothetical protein